MPSDTRSNLLQDTRIALRFNLEKAVTETFKGFKRMKNQVVKVTEVHPALAAFVIASSVVGCAIAAYYVYSG